MTFVRAPIVQGLWIGERLSEMEQLSIRSFLANGHDYHRYTFGPVAGVPEGAAVRDASEILPKERIWKYADQDSYAGYSNHFRYRLLYERGGIWADCDVVCLRPLSLREHAVASEDADDGGVFRATCVIAAPAGSALMRRAMQVCDTADVNTLKWGDTGPKLMTRLVEEMGFEDAVYPTLAFCPVPHQEFQSLLSGDVTIQESVEARLAGAQAVHLWHELWRRSGLDTVAPHPRDCVYERLKARYLRESKLTGGVTT